MAWMSDYISQLYMDMITDPEGKQTVNCETHQPLYKQVLFLCNYFCKNDFEYTHIILICHLQGRVRILMPLLIHHVLSVCNSCILKQATEYQFSVKLIFVNNPHESGVLHFQKWYRVTYLRHMVCAYIIMLKTKLAVLSSVPVNVPSTIQSWLLLFNPQRAGTELSRFN